MNEVKIAPFEGEDGKLYFHYPLHALYKFKSTDGQPLFEYEITDCFYLNDEENYSMVCNGSPLEGTKTLEQVNLIFSCFDSEVDGGELVELPLLKDEVKQYFEDKTKERDKANAAANAELKGTDYFKLKSEIESCTRPLRFAKSQGDSSTVAELTAKINDLKAKQSDIVREKGLDWDIITKKCKCTRCYDTGLTDEDEICDCALAQAEEIKKYNAELRKARRGQAR